MSNLSIGVIFAKNMENLKEHINYCGPPQKHVVVSSRPDILSFDIEVRTAAFYDISIAASNGYKDNTDNGCPRLLICSDMFDQSTASNIGEIIDCYKRDNAGDDIGAYTKTTFLTRGKYRLYRWYANGSSDKYGEIECSIFYRGL